MACLACSSTAWAEEVASPHPDWVNLAAGKMVQFNTAPNYPDVTDADDAKQMVDGRLSPATPLWGDRSVIGWATGNPVVFTLDLGAVAPIRGVAWHVGAGQAGVEWPTSILIYVSEAGDKFRLVGGLMPLLTERPPAQGYAACWLVADKLETKGRYVKFVCTPTNLGNGAYIFIDEVKIYRGDDAWLKRPLSAGGAPEQWRAAWQEIEWRDNAGVVSESERPTRLRLVDGKSELGGDTPLYQAVVEKNGMSFQLTGEAGKPRRMSWTGQLAKPVSTENCRYALLTFRAEGINRVFDVQPLVALHGFNEQSPTNVVMLLEANQALNDGLRHTLLKQLPAGFVFQQLQVTLPTENDEPHLTLERLELLSEVPEVFNTEIVAAAPPPAAGFAPADLGAALNGRLADWYERVLSTHKTVLDGVRALKAGPVTVSGVPFVIAAGEKNLAVMPESEPSVEQVEFLGQKVHKRFLEPESRNDTLSVDVDLQAREAFLLLALSAPPVQVRYGIPPSALRLDDIEVLSIELTYDRGENEIAFPYSLADKGCYIPARELGAYAVAVDPARRLKKVTLHNHQFGPSFALAGLTFNTSKQALVPELASVPAPEATRQNPKPADQPVAVTRQGSRLTFSNRWYEYGFDLAQGFVIDRFANRWNESAKIRLAPASGLRVRVGDTIYTGRSFKSEVVRLTESEAELKLTSAQAELPLEIEVTITANDSPELAFAVQMTNRGDQPLAAELCLPALAGLVLGDLAQTRFFFPEYRAVDTDKPIVLRAPYGPEFTGQFMDVYSRQAGIGLMVRTDNREERMATFTLRKDESGVTGGVCFPAQYHPSVPNPSRAYPHHPLAPGASRAYPRVSLLAHGGDWHAAFQLYRDWMRTWYRPYKAQDKDYLLNAWEIACYRPSNEISWLEAHTPPNITADRKKWVTDEIFAFEKEHHGHVPDLVHFFNWTYNDKEKRNENGVFGTPLAYEQVGGLEFFRQGIADIQNKWQRPVSLYTLIDRFRISALPDQALAKEFIAASAYQVLDNDPSAVLRSSGQDGVVFCLVGYDRWLDFCINDIVKMQRDTGCKLVYVDVLPYWSHLPGYNGISPREADLLVVRRLRELLPADVAIWSEYCMTDVASQYADGALQYYFLDLHQTFARRYNGSDRADDLCMELPLNLGRYVLTRYKTIGLYSGSKPSQVDALFVNGEAFQEDTWQSVHSRLRVKVNRAYVIKHQYNDCFNSDRPIPQVDTAVRGIAANFFPGKNRNLWTLYNGRPKTYAGVVLTVPHQPGAKYRDAWNDAELKPVIENGLARISLTLDPQQPGCIVQDWN